MNRFSIRCLSRLKLRYGIEWKGNNIALQIAKSRWCSRYVYKVKLRCVDPSGNPIVSDPGQREIGLESVEGKRRDSAEY